MSIEVPEPAPSSTLATRVTKLGASRVLVPADPDFAEQLSGFNLAIAHRPDVVVAATSVQDVQAAVRTATETGVPLYVLATNHGSITPMSGGIAVTTRGLANVRIDIVERTATVGAGTVWNEVVTAAAANGLAALCGSSPTVGVIGYLLGGGMGPFNRTYGFSSDRVREFEVVTATGDIIVASASEHADLFWALRGSKSVPCIVTRTVIDLVPLPTFYGGGVFFPAADAAAVVHRFSEWSADLPDTLSTSIALLRLPPLPELPEPIRGQFVVHLRIAYVGERADTDALLGPMLEAGTPLLAMLGEMPYSQIALIHSDPVDPLPVLDGGLLLSSFGSDAADALLAVAGPDRDVPLIAVEMRLMGGAIAREPEIPSAVAGRDAAYLLHVVSAPVPELFQTVVPAAIDGVFASVSPWSTGTTQVNFVGAANRDRREKCWDEGTRERIRSVRETYDPSGIFAS